MAYKPPDKEGNKDWWKTGEGKLNLPQRFGNRILKRIHRAFPMGTRRMQDLLQHSEVKIRQGNQLIEDIVKNCKACQLTNAPNQPVTKGARLHGDRPGDWVFVRRHNLRSLEPWWKGPYMVLLATPTALKVTALLLGSTAPTPDRLTPLP
ncbi:uncharacterized protein [Dipodomys merriami]|uniref:uncharacterized protein isoform X2 n=1 Tax=Dipodomys merriami TaxID=94247 RepID=UPI00385590C9